MQLFSLAIKLPGKVWRLFGRHAMIVASAVAVIGVTAILLLSDSARVAAAIVTVLMLFLISIRQIRSNDRRKQTELLLRYLYQGKPSPEFSKLTIATIQRNLLASGQVLEADRLISFYRCLDAIKPAAVAELARKLARLGYYERARFYYSQLPDKARKSREAEISKLATQIEMFESKFDVKFATSKLKVQRNRVLHVVKQTILDKQAGYTIRTHRIARAQARLGLDVHVVGQLGFGKGISQKVVDGVTYHSLSWPGNSKHGDDSKWFARNAKALHKFVAELKPEYLHAASDFLNAAAANLVGKATGIKVIYEVRGFWEETFMAGFQLRHGGDIKPLDSNKKETLPDSYVMRQKSEAKWALASDYVLTLAPTMKTRLESYGVSSKKISLVPNAVDPDDFKPLARDVNLLNRIGLDSEYLVIGYISSLSAYEGVDVLIDAVAEFKRAQPNKKIALVVVGGGKELENLRSRAAATQFKDILLLGQVPHTDVAKFYSIIDIFVVPRLPFDVCHLVSPLKPYEAMAMGKAMVLSNVQALSDIAKESGSALTFEAGNPDSLVEVLSKLAADPKKRAAMGAKASKWVLSERTWDQVAATTLSVYKKLR